MRRSAIRKVGIRGAFSEARCKVLDDILRERLRSITHGRCENCMAPVSKFYSQVSHGYTRKIKSLRWDRLNVLHLCASCHWFYTNSPPMAEAFLRRHLGDVGYDELVRRWMRKTLVKELDYDQIKAYIGTIELGKFPQVSPVPLWELGK